MIDINNESGVQADELGLVALARFALSRLRIHPQADLSILLVDPVRVEVRSGILGVYGECR